MERPIQAGRREDEARRSWQRGFTLVELIIVMAVIITLAAIAIPRFLRARFAANESAALATTRVYSTQLENYRSAQTPPAYPPDLTSLGSSDPPYVDDTLGQDPATRQGYTYTYAQISEAQYALTAQPELEGVSGVRVFYVDETGVIRLDDANGSAVE